MEAEGRRKKAPPPPSRPPPPRSGSGRGPPPKGGPGRGASGGRGRGRGKSAAAQWRLKNSSKPGRGKDDDFDDLQLKRKPNKKASRYEAADDYSYSDEDDYEDPRTRRQGRRKYNGSDEDQHDDAEARSPRKARRPPSRQNRNRDVGYAADDYEDDEEYENRRQKPSRQSPKDTQAWGRDRVQKGRPADDAVEDLVEEVEEITIDASGHDRPRKNKSGRGPPPRGNPRGKPKSGRGNRGPSSRDDEEWNQPLDIYDQDGDVEEDAPAWAENRGPVDYAATTMESTYSEEEHERRNGRGGGGKGGRGGGRRPPPRQQGSGRSPQRGRNYSQDYSDEDYEDNYERRDPDRSRGTRSGKNDWVPRDERHGAPEWKPKEGGRPGRGGGENPNHRRQYDRYSDEEEFDEEDDIREEYKGHRQDDLDDYQDRRALGGLPWRTSSPRSGSEEDPDDPIAARGQGRFRSRVPEMPSPSAMLNPTLYDYRNIPFVFRELQEFVTNPPPGGPGTMVHCFIQRDRSGTKKLAPVYTLYSDHEDGSGRLILSARKVLKSKTPYYVISTQREDLYRDREERSHHYLGKLRGNSSQTEYIMFDSGDNPNHLNQRETDSESDADHNSYGGRSGSAANSVGEIREELAVIHYVREKKQDGLRRMEVGTPKLKYYQDPSHPDGGQWVAENWRPQREMDTMANKFARVRQEGGQNVVAADRLFMMHKRESRYDPLSSCLVDFKGRARQASVKNYQLVKSWPTDREMRRQYFSSGGEGADEQDDEEAAKPVLLQMGKFGKDCFNMDYQWPLSMLQAFGICLSRFDTKLYY